MSGEQIGSNNNKRVNLDKIIGECPTVDVLMNGVPLKCLVDTGSQVSTITESFYNSFSSQFQELTDVSQYIRLNASNGLDIPLSGLLRIPITLDNHVYDDVHTRILIVKDSINPKMRARKEHVPGLIGCNVLHLLKQAMLNNELIPSANMNEIIESYNLHLTQQVLMDQMEQKSNILAFVKSSGKDVIIPANTMTEIEGTTRCTPNNMKVIIEPTQSPVPDLIVIPTYTTVEEGRVVFLVANVGSTDICLHLPTQIAKNFSADEL